MREVAPLVISLTDLMLPLEYWGVPLGRDSHMNAFASRGEIRKHSHRKHLRYHSDSQLIACPYPKCDVVLNSITHLQNHVEKSHQNHCHYGAYLFPGILQAKIAFLAAAFCCSINDRAHGGIYTLINLGIYLATFHLLLFNATASHQLWLLDRAAAVLLLDGLQVMLLAVHYHILHLVY